MGCLVHTNEKLLSKEEGSDIIFKTMLLPELQRQPRSGFRTSPSGSCFDQVSNELLMNCLKPLKLSGTTLTLLLVKSCLQVRKGYSMLSYFIYSIRAILANFLICD